MINDTDRTHLRRCVELAAKALASGDEPFGSVLVSSSERYCLRITTTSPAAIRLSIRNSQ